jgi:predicted DNA-binding protein (MmcQ/YjbR family)
MPESPLTRLRKICLALPEAEERETWELPTFRVRDKIFASLDVSEKGWGTVKLTPEQQEILMEAEPAAFKPAAGAWGRRGWTQVRLAAVDSRQPQAIE